MLHMNIQWKAAWMLFAITTISTNPTQAAIMFGQIDDFQDGLTHNWSGLDPTNEANAGPNGNGDNALLATAFGGGSAFGKLLVRNQGQQWSGNWTDEGVTKIKLDIRNPNAFDLTIRLAIAGPGGVGATTGDTYATLGQVIPDDNAWHSVIFDVQAGNFTPVGTGSDSANALTSVNRFRIIHNPAIAFIGEEIAGSFLVDNIQAIPEPSTIALVLISASLIWPTRRLR